MRKDEPRVRSGRLLAMVFDEFLAHNFAANSHAVMGFQFDLVWRERLDAPANWRRRWPAIR